MPAQYGNPLRHSVIFDIKTEGIDEYVETKWIFDFKPAVGIFNPLFERVDVIFTGYGTLEWFWTAETEKEAEKEILRVVDNFKELPENYDP